MMDLSRHGTQPNLPPQTITRPESLEFRLFTLRGELNHGEGVGQERLDAVLSELHPHRAQLRPADKDEWLPLFDSAGGRIGTFAPRWMCHLLALRHCCVHVMTTFRHESLGEMAFFQIRSPDKDICPGAIDISVSGHVTRSTPRAIECLPVKEMLDEINIGSADLETPLSHLGSYSWDEVSPEWQLFNSEWVEMYMARLRPDAVSSISFTDGEVAGMIMTPVHSARQLLQSPQFPTGTPWLLKFLDYLKVPLGLDAHNSIRV